jgi:hypothetical protein
MLLENNAKPGTRFPYRAVAGRPSGLLQALVTTGLGAARLPQLHLAPQAGRGSALPMPLGVRTYSMVAAGLPGIEQDFHSLSGSLSLLLLFFHRDRDIALCR